MTNILIRIMVALIALSVSLSTMVHAANLAKATVVVVDEDGKPIPEANAYIFHDGLGGATKGTTSKGQTDLTGRYSDTMINYNGYLAYGAKKDGYYETHQDYYFKNVSLGRLEPWNPELTVILRKTLNPVPMYARDTQHAEKQIELPVAGKKVGFDLIAYDWVPPYGNGVNADFIFYLERHFEAWNHQDCKLEVTFANKFDGIQKYEMKLRNGSFFKLPRFAPENGYENKLLLFIDANAKGYATNYKTNMKEDDHFFFKIRSNTNENNSSIYGKIQGGFWFSPRGSKNTAIISIKYYINPDHTRNLEFDPLRNLFGVLPFMESVRDP